MTPIVFCDVDGVLVTRKTILAKNPNEVFDKACVKNLNTLCDRTGASIVVSSSWRRGRSVQQLQVLFAREGVKAPVIDKTPEDGQERGKQILQWIDEQKEEVVSYVVLDDDSWDIHPYITNYVHLANGMETGLRMEHVHKAVEILNVEVMK